MWVRRTVVEGIGKAVTTVGFLILTAAHCVRADVPVALVGQWGGATHGVAVQGSLAYVGAGPVLLILDVARPASPTLVGRSPLLPATPVEGVTVAGNYAYIADGSAGLQIIDVSNLDSPVLIGGCDTSGYASAVTVSGSYAYIADDTSGLQIIDVSNPAHPVWIGQYIAVNGNARGVAISGSFAYVKDWTGHLRVLDVSDPVSPVVLGVCNLTGSRDYAGAVVITDRHVYVTHSGLHIVDVFDPANPVRIGGYAMPGITHGLAISDGRAYVANDVLGIQMIDVSDPANPVWVGGYNAPGTVYSVAAVGRYIYVADDGGGVDILRVGMLGDLNCDGTIDGRDINPFVVYLSDLSAWRALLRGCPSEIGDINGDGTYPSFKDINPFVVLLSGE